MRVGEYLEKSFVIKSIGKDTLKGIVTESCNGFSTMPDSANYNLAPGESLTVAVRFQPDSLGDKLCVIETGNSACSDVNCFGTGGEPPPACSVYPSSIDFGKVSGTIDTTFTITNTGYVPLEGFVSKSSHPSSDCFWYFFFVSGQGSYNLAPRESKIVKIRFAPVLGTPVTCYISTGNEVCGDVYCIGQKGGLPSCSVSTTLLDFGTVHIDSMAQKTFVIYNTSVNEKLSGKVEFDLGSSSTFVILSGGGNYSLNPRQSREVTVGFNPWWDNYYTATILPDYSFGSRPACCENVVCVGKGKY
jgi:hypothetical protein